MLHVYCDESGFSGANLFDREQPVLIYGSHTIPDDECLYIKRTFFENHAGPLKHSKLMRRSPSALCNAIKYIFSSHNDKIFATVSEKKSVAITKFVDLFIEPVAHASGHDLYSNHENINYSKLLKYTIKDNLGEGPLEHLLVLFVNFYRDQVKEKFIALKNYIDTISSQNKRVSQLLIPAKQYLNSTSYDTAFSPEAQLSLSTSDVALTMQRWSEKLPDKFTLHCDNSNEIINEIGKLKDLFYSERIEQKTYGYGERTFIFPTNCIQIQAEDDANCIGIQIADIISGALGRHAAYNVLNMTSPKNKRYADNLKEILKEIMLEINIIFLDPTPEVPPKTYTPKRTFDNFVEDLHALRSSSDIS